MVRFFSNFHRMIMSEISYKNCQKYQNLAKFGKSYYNKIQTVITLLLMVRSFSNFHRMIISESSYKNFQNFQNLAKIGKFWEKLLQQNSNGHNFASNGPIFLKFSQNVHFWKFLRKNSKFLKFAKIWQIFGKVTTIKFIRP